MCDGELEDLVLNLKVFWARDGVAVVAPSLFIVESVSLLSHLSINRIDVPMSVFEARFRLYA